MVARQRSRRRIGSSIAVVPAMLGLLIGVVLLGAGQAFAHANLLAASPGPGQVVGGTVDRLQLAFDEPISDLNVSIEGPDDTEMAVDIAKVGAQQFDVGFTSLMLEGRYLVRYDFVSNDSDRVELGFGFDYDVDGPAALPISGPTIVESSEPASLLPWLVIGALVLAVVIGALQLARRRRELVELRSSR